MGRLWAHPYFLARLVRYFFLGTGLAFLAWELSEIFLLGEGPSFKAGAEIAMVSVLGPAVIWFATKRGERLISEIEQRHQEVLAVNQMAQQVLAERAQLTGDLGETRRHLQLLLGVNQAVGLGLPPKEVARKVLEVVIEVLGLEAGEIWLLDASLGQLWLLAQQGLPQEALEEKAYFALGEGFPGLAVQSRAPVYTTDLAREARFLRHSIINAGFSCFGAVPIFSGEEVIGALTVGSRHYWWLRSGEIDFLTDMARGLAPLLKSLAGR